MKKCEHECKECGKKWECSYPYYSNFQFFNTVVNNGYYCNSFCPSCQAEKRKELDLLYSDVSETGYVKSFVSQVKDKTYGI